jgi:hypothetical protein
VDKRSKLTRALCAAAGAVALAAALGAGAARAADPVLVSVLRCADEGPVTVPAGVPITLHLGGYADGTFGLINVALLAQTTTLDVSGPSGDALYDLSDQWSAPLDTGLGFWLTTQPDRTLAPLAAGQRVIVTYDIRFSHPVAVLFQPVGPTGDNGPFVITEDGPAVCEIDGA